MRKLSTWLNTRVIVLPIAVLIGVLPCGFVLASVASDADGGRNGWPFTRGYVYCDKEKKCYHSNPYGGWGLEPKRTYKLDYDGGPACKVIKDALNNAIKIGKKSEEHVIFLTPRYPEYESLADAKLEKDVDGREFRYYAQNPLFSDQIFLKWNFLGGYPDKDFPEMRGKYGYDETAWAHRHDIHDTFPKRWLIVPYKNDGRPYLLTAWVWGNGTTVGVEPPKVFNVWDIRPEELTNQDWNLAKAYSPYTPLKEKWTNSVGETWGVDPIMMMSSRIYRKSADCLSKEHTKESALLDKFTNLCRKHKVFGFVPDTLQFAKVQDRYYTLLVSVADKIIVSDASKESAEIECYLSSQISRKIK